MLGAKIAQRNQWVLAYSSHTRAHGTQERGMRWVNRGGLICGVEANPIKECCRQHRQGWQGSVPRFAGGVANVLHPRARQPIRSIATE